MWINIVTHKKSGNMLPNATESLQNLTRILRVVADLCIVVICLCKLS